MSTLTISSTALNLSIPSTLTNEIPHLSIYSILNKHLRNTWSEKLIGRATANYGQDFNSIKKLNGEISKNYTPHNITFADPNRNTVYNVDLEKIDFSVDGAIETEIDYLMHENARYLTKLYPDDFNTLITLTEAERQSYINEALHMIHSYFDTEQITVNDIDVKVKEMYELYYRNKFLTGITKVRSLTGVVNQEEKLLSLINTGKIISYTGYKTYITSDGLSIITNNDELEKFNLSNLHLEGFFYIDEKSIAKEALMRLHGKVRNSKLKDFLENSIELLEVNENFFKSLKEFFVLPSTDPLELADDLINGKLKNTKSFNLNELFKEATAAGAIKAGANINTLKATEFNTAIVDFVDNTPVYFCFSQNTNTADLVAFKNKTSDYFELQNLENRLVATTNTVKNIKNSYVMKLGKYHYTDLSLLAIGNIVISDITNLYRINETFANYFNSIVTSSAKLQTIVSISQNEKLVFAGLLNKSYFLNNSYTDLINRYTIADFDKNINATDIFSHILYKDLVETITFNVQKEIKITYSNVLLDQEKYLNNTAVIYLDRDPLKGISDYKIIITKNDSYYDIVLTYKNSEDKTITYTGNTEIQELSSNEITKKLYCYSDRNEITIENITFIVDEKDTFVKRKDTNKIVGRLATQIENNIKYFSIEILDLLKSSDLTTRTYGNLSIDNYEQSDLVLHQDAMLTNLTSSTNTLEISIDWFLDLQTLIESTTDITIVTSLYAIKSESAEDSKQYLYSTNLKLKSSLFKYPDCIINNIELASILFNSENVNLYKLQTYKCYFYANNLLRINKDIVDTVNTYGRINCIILDNYNNYYPAKIQKASVKNEYCYLTLTSEIENLTNKDNREGYLIIDLEKESSTTSTISIAKNRRELLSKNIYVFQNQKYLYKYTWENLKKENLNFIFNNIFSENVNTSYAVNSAISQNTNTAFSLSELENCTIFDAINVDLNTKTLLENLIDENKSLYLDSTVKSLINVPLAIKNLVINDQYGTYSYILSNNIPSYITFYKFDEYNQYQPLQELLEAENKKEINLVDLEKRLNRRFVLWGNVVWDANVDDRPIRVLRSIWSSYFSNFEIYDSEDLLPDESILFSFSNSSNFYTKTQNIINYNYSENDGTPDLNWNIALTFSRQNTNNSLIDVVNAYSHKQEAVTNTVIFDRSKNLDKIFTNNFYFYLNKVDIENNMLKLTIVENKANIINLQNVNLKVEDITEDLQLNYFLQDNSYKALLKKDIVLDEKDSNIFYNNTSYKLNLIYNMIHIDEENFEAAGVYNNYCNNTALEMLLEFYTYQYYAATYKGYSNRLNTFIRENISNINFNNTSYFDYYKNMLFDADQEENWGENKTKEINIKDVLDFAISLNSNFSIPSIAVIDNTGKVKIYAFIIAKNSKENYTIYSTKFIETINGDLLYSLLPTFYKKFQVNSSLIGLYSQYFNRYQYLIPNNASGKITDLSIDLQTVQDKDNVLSPNPSLSETNFKLKQDFLDKISATNKNILLNQETTYLTDIFSKNINIDETLLTIQDRSYKFSNKDLAFREYYNTNVQLYTEEPKTTNYDIKKCVIHFEDDFNLTNKGYLYLYDIKASNKRTSYLPSRETQIVDRSYQINSLHAIGYSLNDNKIEFLLQDSSKNYTKYTSRSIETITPTDTSLNNQLIDDIVLKLGISWEDPKVDIGYTFYKRKFIAEGIIDSTDTTKINLSDSILLDDNTFSLLDHVSVGDTVEVYVTNPSSFFQNGQLAEISINNNDNYIGPYKVIYTKTITNTASRSSSDSVTAIQQVILSGPGNLVYVNVDLTNTNITISEPYIFDSSYKYSAYTLSSGEIVYYDVTTKSTILICNVEDFVSNKGVLKNTQEPSTIFIAANTPQTSDGSTSLQVSIYNQEDKLLNTHTNWYNFDNSNISSDDLELTDTSNIPSVEDLNENQLADVNTTVTLLSEEPTTVLNSIPLNNGYLNFDNYDRSYFEASEDDESEPNWKNIPDKIEFFDASEHLNSITLLNEDTQSEENIQIENATESQLRHYIRDTLTTIFGAVSFEGSLDNLNAINTVEDISSIKALLSNDNLTFTIPSNEGNQIENSLKAFAKIVYQQDSGTINLKNAIIYIPNIVEYDIPVYFKLGSSPKWKKVYILTNTTNETLENADLETLQKFTRAILAKDDIIRENLQITNWIKNNKNIILFDQDTATLTVLDKNGDFLQKVAIPSLGLNQPIVSQNFTKNSLATAYIIPNKIYLATNNTSFSDYINRSNALDRLVIEENEYGIYEIFEQGNPLYLPSIFSNYTNKTVEEIENDLEKKYNIFVTEDRLNEVANAIYIASNEESFENWLQICKHLNYLNIDSCEYAAFKDINNTCNLKILSYAIQTIFGEDSVSFAACESILQQSSSLVETVIKGIDYFNSSTENYKDFVNKNITAISASSKDITSFESLINTSNIELTENYVHIYGTVDWPAITGTNSILSKIESQLRLKLSSDETVDVVTIDDIVTNNLNEIKTELLANFASFYGEENYPENGATKSFKLSISLDNYYVTKTQITNNSNNSILPVVSLKNNTSGLEALTTKGTFNLGDENNQILDIDSETITNVNIKKGLLYVYEALKSLDTFSGNVSITDTGNLQVNLSGLTIQNAETFYSTIASVQNKSITLAYDTIVLDEGAQANVIFMVKDLIKDNFKLGFGNISNIDYILPAQTLFEVNTPEYADFATYENSASYTKLDTNLNIYKKDTVFDLYPTFEVIDEDKVSNFYKLDKNKNVKYIQNSRGRNLIRLNNIYSDIGGKLVTRNTEVTIANEYINDDYLGNTENDINSILLTTKRTINKSYSSLLEKYNLQFIPALVENPQEAISDHAYKDIHIGIESGEINIFDSYATITASLNDNLKIEKINDVFRIATKEEVINTSVEKTLEESNKAQIDNLSNSKNWKSLPINANLVNVNLKIINKTETLPKFYNITKFNSYTDSNNNLILNTNSTELYIPEKGYGQAIIGDYKVPKDCLFEDKIFFDQNLKTLNKNNEQFTLVDSNGNPYNNETVYIPKLIYKSFAQADILLTKDLATKTSIDIADSLINLSYFNVTPQSIWFEKAYKLNLLNFASDTTTSENSINYSNYEKFLNNIKFSCKLIWSEQLPNKDTSNTLNITNYNSKYYNSLDLLEKLGYTRLYKNNSIPANYKYLNRDNTYSITTGSILRDQSRYSVDENGNLLYLDTDGNLTTTKTVNPVLPAAKNLNTLVLLDIKNDSINTVVDNCFYMSKYYIKLNYNNKTIDAASSTLTRSILAVNDPNKATSSFNYIQDVTLDNFSWPAGTSLSWKFNTDKIQFNLSYPETVRSYNFAYLHDKAGNLVAKIFFKNNIDKDTLLVLSKEN